MYVDPNLPRQIFGWHSPRLGIDMPIVQYGDRGHPVLLFPTAQADFLENEEANMRNFVSQQMAANDFAGFMGNLEARAEIEGRTEVAPTLDEAAEEF